MHSAPWRNHKSIAIFFTIIIVLWASVVGWYVYSVYNNTFAAPPAPGSTTISPSHSPETEISRPKQTPTVTMKRPNFETGMVFPGWQPDGYSDKQWQTDLPQMKIQTGAGWVEMPLLFQQPSISSTAIAAGQKTPTIASFISGIQMAHAQGFHVFVVPLVSPWSGFINFSTLQDEQQWFTNYWNAYKPYILAAAQNNVEQLAVGTEDDWLQQNAPASLWNTLIANIHSIFSGTLTYDMNWIQQLQPLPSWMKNPYLKVIGFSEYIPLISTPTRVDPQAMRALWKKTVKPIIDGVAHELGKPILISEIGYRNSSDTLFQPYQTSTGAPADPSEQAAACNAAIAEAVADPNITGIYFWGWENVETFSLKGLPAVSTIHKWFTSSEI
jgi:hypothetical protein